MLHYETLQQFGVTFQAVVMHRMCYQTKPKNFAQKEVQNNEMLDEMTT